MPDTITSLAEEFEARLAAIPLEDQRAQMIAALQALGWGTPEMQAMIDGLEELQTFVFDTDPSLQGTYTFIHGVIVSGRPLQEMCVPPAPPPAPPVP